MVLVNLALAAVVSCGGDEPGALSTQAAMELQGRWWSWARSQPPAQDPVADTVGTHCDVDQPADVWFLAGTNGGHATRRCEVPAGVPLAGPAITNLTETQGLCTGFMFEAEGEVLVDGTAQPLTRIDAAPMTLTVDGKSTEAVSCGLWFWIEPLPVGEHEVRLRGGDEWGFDTSATYTITVTAGDDRA